MKPGRSGRIGWRGWIMRRAGIVAFGAAIVGAVGAAGASAATSSTAVKLGLVLPLSGSAGTQGTAAEHGAQLAVQQANRGKLVPGVTFSLVARSDVGTGGTPSGATGATQIKGMIGNGQIAGVVAPFDTNTALAELPLANRAPLATVSPFATATCLTTTGALGCTGTAAELTTVEPTGRTSFFRVAAADALQGTALANFLFTTGGIRSAYLVDDGSSAGGAQAATFISAWRSDGGALIGHASVAPGPAYVNLLTSIAAQKPGALVYTGADAGEGTTLRQEMFLIPGLSNTPFAATSSVHTSAFLQAVGNPLAPVWAVAPAPQLAQLPSASSFTTSYQAKFGTASTDAARGYDSAQALVLAIKAAIAGGAKPPATAGSSATAFRTAVIAALAQTEFKGADGTIAFSADGDLKQGPVEIDRLSAAGAAPSWTPAGVLQVAAPTPTGALSSSALDFGRVATQSSAELSLQVVNTGLVPLGVGSPSVKGGGFALASTNCTTANVLPSATCTVTIRFAPTTAGAATGTVTVFDSAGATLGTTTLSGTGVKALSLPAAVYVGNGGNSAIHSFTLPLAAGQTAATTLAGPDTGLDGTGAVAIDKFGQLYVANSDSETITVYPGNTTGDARPSAVISGPDTGIANPTAIAVDAQSFLYVANAAANTVTVYAPGASGDASPVRTINGLFGPSGLVLDGAGNLWVANSPGNSLERFGPTDTKPSATISGPSTGLDGPQSLTLDGAGNVVVADEYSSALTAYAPTDNGDVAPAYSITGPATGLDFPVGLDVDAAGNFYVSNLFANTITVYSPHSRDDAAPLETLSGAQTGLAAPEHLAVSPPLTILTHTLPVAHTGRNYHTRLIASFGTGRYHWTIRRGHLPRGLQLNAQTGLLTGITHQTGLFPLRVRVTDHSRPVNVATEPLTLIVRAGTRSAGRRPVGHR